MIKCRTEEMARDMAAERKTFYGFSALDPEAWFVGSYIELRKIGVVDPKTGNTNPFNGFYPPTVDTFGEHYRREVYRHLIRAVRAIRIEDFDRARHQIGRADCCVSVLYDLQHARAWHALSRYNKTMERLRPLLEKRGNDGRTSS